MIKEMDLTDDNDIDLLQDQSEAVSGIVCKKEIDIFFVFKTLQAFLAFSQGSR